MNKKHLGLLDTIIEGLRERDKDTEGSDRHTEFSRIVFQLTEIRQCVEDEIDRDETMQIMMNAVMDRLGLT